MHSETTSTRYSDETYSLVSNNSIVIRAVSTSSSYVDSNDTADEDTDVEDDSSDESDSESFEYDAIHRADSDQFYSEKEDAKTYIGLAHLLPGTAAIVMSNTISPGVYFAHPHTTVIRYLYAYGLIRIKRPVLQVMTLHILADGTYSMLLQTHWIRLVQRHWRKIYRQRRIMIRKRANPQARKLFELSGKYPYPLHNMPSLRGMLSCYSNSPARIVI
jgi:hypothetical protein